MKKVTLTIQDTKFQFFMELIKNLDFVKVEEDEGDSKEEIIANLKQGFKELNLYKQGKLQTTPAKEFLNEL
jgi:hypothetical protein